MAINPNLTDIALVPYQESDRFDEARTLIEDYYGAVGMMASINKTQSLISPELAEEFYKNGATGRDFNFDVIKESEITVDQYRASYNIPDNPIEVASRVATLQGAFTGFGLIPAQFNGTNMKVETAITDRMYEVDKAIAKTFCSDTISKLESTKATSLNVVGTGLTFNATSDVLEISLADREERFMDKINQVLLQSGLGRMKEYVLLYNLEMNNSGILNDKYGEANQFNLSGQAMPSESFACDTDVLDNTGVEWTAFLVRRDAIAMMDALPSDFWTKNPVNLMARDANVDFSIREFNTATSWSIGNLPIRTGVLAKAGAFSDNSTVNRDLDATGSINWGFLANYSFMTRYKQKDEFPIVKIQGLLT